MNFSDMLANTEQLYDGDLAHYFRVVMQTNPGNNNPYHNFRHLGHVTWMCYKGCVYYRNELDPREMRDLLIAALFHDYAHRGRSGNDDLNIELAVRGLRPHLLPEDVQSADTIYGLIRSTEFPHVLPADHLSLAGQILRDADMSQSASDAWLQQVVFGLAAEMGISPLEMLHRQIGFHEQVEPITDWGKKEFGPSILEKLKEAHALLRLLHDD